MRNGNLLKNRVSEIRLKRIRVNQGVGVGHFKPLHLKIIEIQSRTNCNYLEIFNQLIVIFGRLYSKNLDQDEWIFWT